MSIEFFMPHHFSHKHSLATSEELAIGSVKFMVCHLYRHAQGMSLLYYTGFLASLRFLVRPHDSSPPLARILPEANASASPGVYSEVSLSCRACSLMLA